MKFRQLDASIEASEPHDFPVRITCCSSAAHQRPSHPEPNVRDDRETPLLVGRDGAGYGFDLGQTRRNIFSQPGLDSQTRSICPAGKIAFGKAHVSFCRGPDNPLYFPAQFGPATGLNSHRPPPAAHSSKFGRDFCSGLVLCSFYEQKLNKTTTEGILMSDASAAASHLQVFIHSDDETPSDFMVDLLHSVFKIPFAKADNLAETTDTYGQALCGTYPREVANEVLVAARQRIQAAGHPLLITTEAVTADDAAKRGCCKVCGASSNCNLLSLNAIVCDDCIEEVRSKLAEKAPDEQFGFGCEALGWHFIGLTLDQLVANSRLFPGHMRAEVQTALDRMFSAPIRFFGIHERDRYETLTIGTLLGDDNRSPAISPPHYNDVDIGDSSPVKCLQNGLWLCEAEGLRYAVLLSSHREYSREAEIRVEIAVPAGAAGSNFVARCFSELASAINAAPCYRGK